jgi:hypothetical protein
MVNLPLAPDQGFATGLSFFMIGLASLLAVRRRVRQASNEMGAERHH